MYYSDPFAEETIALGEEVMQDISGVKIEKQKNVVEAIDMKNNSYKAWKSLRKLNSEKVEYYCLVWRNSVYTKKSRYSHK